MFIGHFGVGLGAKKIDTKPSLGTLFFAAQFVDLLWPIFLLLGIEKVKIDPSNIGLNPLNFIYFPFSHSLIAVIIWGIVFGAVHYFVKKNFKTALLLGALVVSHWVLDLLVHVPDLPIIPGVNLKVGISFWNYPVIAIVIELAIFVAGTFLYLQTTKSRNKKGSYGFWGLIIFLILIYFSNMFGSTPPNVETIAWVGNFQWLIVIWGYWIDRNRDVN